MTEPTPQELVAEVRTALEAATPGPWSDYRQDCLPREQRTTTIKAVTVRQDNWRAAQTVAKTDQTSKRKYDDAYLIANAPTWLGQLCTALTAALDANREMHAENEALCVGLRKILHKATVLSKQDNAILWIAREAKAALTATEPTGVSLRAELAELKADVARALIHAQRDELAEAQKENALLRQPIEMYDEEGNRVAVNSWTPVESGRLEELEGAERSLAEAQELIRMLIATEGNLFIEAKAKATTFLEGAEDWSKRVATPAHLRGDGPCQDCGSLNIVWFTDNVVWNAVMEAEKHAFASDRPETGILCPFCFVKRAEEAGLRPTGWRVTPEWPWRTAALADAAMPEARKSLVFCPGCKSAIYEQAAIDGWCWDCNPDGRTATPETEQAP